MTSREIRFKKFRLLLFPVLSALFFLTSCIPQDTLTYVQDQQLLGDELKIHIEEYRLRPGDILHVRVMSTDPVTNSIFNFEEAGRATMRTNVAGDQMMFLYGYTINRRGEIQMPVIGNVRVVGLTTDEVHQRIQEMAEEYIIDATVSVKIVNFSVTVLGEVRQPGSFYIYDHDFTIMDALGLAGDLTDYGNRNIHVIRRTDYGLKFNTLDITDRNAVTSELYYLQPNDLVYVEPLLAKRFGFAQFPFGVFFTAISTTILLISFLR
jgi:polysaccharide biosynthesis/export protein